MTDPLRLLFSHLLVGYGYYLPYHRGKWRIIDLATTVFHLQGVPPTPVTVKRNTLWFTLNTHYYLDRSLYYLGSHETKETRFIQKIVKPGWIVCDVGANIGWYTLISASAMRGSGCVHAFEPTPEEFQRLKRNVMLNGLTNVKLHAMAMSECPGEVGLTEIRDAGTTRLATCKTEAARIVRTTTLDSFVHEMGLNRLDLVKVDIEGAELRFLYGAQHSLRRFRPAMIVEISADNLATFGATPQGLITALGDLRYTLYRSGWRCLSRLREIPGHGRFFNVVALPSESLDRQMVSWEEAHRWAIERRP